MFLKFCTLVISIALLTGLQPLSMFAQKSEKDSSQRVGVYPLPILFYTPETGIAGGAAALYIYRDTIAVSTRASAISADVIYSEKKQVVVEFGGDFYFATNGYRLLTTATFKKFPNSFFGIGNNTVSSARESYTPRTYFTRVVLYKNIYSHINIAPQVRYESTSMLETKPGGQLASGAIPGSNGGIVSGLGCVVNWDSRDNTFSAFSGSIYQFAVVFNRSAFGSDFSFTDIEADLRTFSEVLPSQIFAAQVGIQVIDGTAPFRNLVTFGGQNFARGYLEGQYRDNAGIGGQIEYRVPLWWRFGAVAFAGAAQVAHEPSLWSLKEFKLAGGAGIRFFLDPKERVSIRIDMGFGSNSSGMYITANEAF